MFLMGWAHVHVDRAYERFAVRLAGPNWALLREHLRLGVPMGLAYTLESHALLGLGRAAMAVDCLRAMPAISQANRRWVKKPCTSATTSS